MTLYFPLLFIHLYRIEGEMSHDAEKNIDYGRSYEGEDEKVNHHGDNGYSNAYIGSGEDEVEETHRSLKPRQISMIAIGGAIGTFTLPPTVRMKSDR